MFTSNAGSFSWKLKLKLKADNTNNTSILKVSKDWFVTLKKWWKLVFRRQHCCHSWWIWNLGFDFLRIFELQSSEYDSSLTRFLAPLSSTTSCIFYEIWTLCPVEARTTTARLVLYFALSLWFGLQDDDLHVPARIMLMLPLKKEKSSLITFH